MSFLRTVSDLSTAWLTDALGTPVRGFTVEPVGTGQCSSTYRVFLDSDAHPDTVILKIADPDPAVRRTGVMTGQYRQEVRFYGEVAALLPPETLTHSYLAAYDEEAGHFTLLLDDVAPARTGDQLAGCTQDQARLVVRELARLVAPTVDSAMLAVSLDAPSPVNRMVLELILPKYVERYADRITPEQRAIIERFATCFDTWAADTTGPRGIVHNDFRLDNMLFGDGDESPELTIVDWATLRWGSVASDLAYFIGGNLSVADRRTHEKELVELFHAELKKQGVRGFSFDDLWRGYRWESFAGVLMAVAAPMVVTQTERGDEMFMTMLTRHCQQVADLGAMDLLADAHRRTLQVDPLDEGRHEVGEERFWNESWYADAISDDGKLGAYVRVGLVPHLGHVVYTAYVVGEGRPAVAVLDYEAPLPATGLKVETPRFTSDIEVQEPLKLFRVTLDGKGESHADPAAPLRGERGIPVDVRLDLVWETEGVPYNYPVGTRYELPCRVTGTISVGGEVLRLEGPGQRDHSWGDRNWWAMNWTWASAHLDDATRLQVIEARVPGLPVLAVGYEQNPADLIEIKRTHAAYDIPESRLPGRTTATLEPSGTQLSWEPIAYAPLRLTAPDGRVCEFPRAMARVTTSDGRTGLGWLEWGHNVSAPSSGLATVNKALASRAKGLLDRVPESAITVLMGSRAGRGVVAGILRALPRRIAADSARVTNARVRFNIADERSGRTDSYDLVLRLDSAPRVERGSTEPARVTLTLTGTDLVLLGAGRLDSVQAGLDRRIGIEGDLEFMTVLAPLLAGPSFPEQLPLS